MKGGAMVRKCFYIADVDELRRCGGRDAPTGNRDLKIRAHLRTNREHSQTSTLLWGPITRVHGYHD